MQGGRGGGARLRPLSCLVGSVHCSSYEAVRHQGVRVSWTTTLLSYVDDVDNYHPSPAT